MCFLVQTEIFFYITWIFLNFLTYEFRYYFIRNYIMVKKIDIEEKTL